MRLIAVAPNPSIDRLYEFDQLAIGAVNRPAQETRVAGGKGLNVARSARVLGAEVTAVALLAGHAGRWIAEVLAEEGIAGRFAWTDGETRTCVAIHNRADGSMTELNEAGPTLMGTAWDGLMSALRVELAVADVGLVAIAGSLPPGSPPDGIAQLCSLAGAFHIAVAVDAGHQALSLAFDAQPWLVKVNAAEAAAALGIPAAREESWAVSAARSIAARSRGAVVVTLGVSGAIAVDREGNAFRVGPPPIIGPYPVGSGDAFLAGLAVATINGRSFGEALSRGAGAASANALLRGAGRLDPTAAESFASLTRVDVVAGQGHTL
jgi:1-phosphofructokinase family hexose kinase